MRVRRSGTHTVKQARLSRPILRALVVDGDDQRAHLDDAVYALTALPPCGLQTSA